MWFKNLQLYRLTSPFSLDASALEEQLAQRPCRPCGPLEPATQGWAAPLGRSSEALVHAAAGCLLITACRQERLLPTSVVNEMLAERVEELESREMRKLRRKERQELREAILTELMPRAFTRTLRTQAYIDPKGGWIVVDAGSAKKAEDLMTLLRETLGSLPATPPTTQARPSGVMTAWLTGGAPDPGFTADDECELRSTRDEGSVVRCRGQDLGAPEIQAHLEAGKEVSRLAMTWNDRVSFVLDEALAIRRLRFLDEVLDLAAEVDSDDEEARFDADFTIMQGEIAQLLPPLLAAFAGEAGEQAAAA